MSECSIFDDDFELNDDFATWTYSGGATGCTITTQSSVVKDGSYAGQFYVDGDSGSDWVYAHEGPGPVTTAYVSFDYRVTALPQSNTDLFWVGAIGAYGSAWRYIASVQIYNNGSGSWFRLGYQKDASGHQYIQTNIVVATDTWYRIVLGGTLDGGNGRARLWVDNVLKADVNNLNNYDDTTGDYIDRISIGALPLADRVMDVESYFYVDNVCMNTNILYMTDPDVEVAYTLGD